MPECQTCPPPFLIPLSIFEYFSSFKDPRNCNKIVYIFSHLFFILSSMLAGANSIYQIVIFAKAKRKWIENLTGI